MQSQWAKRDIIENILGALTRENALACRVSLVTGLRINDVLAIPTAKWIKQRFTIREEKTGKTKKVRIPLELWREGMMVCGQHYVFEHRLNGREHRTRQAVNKDLRRACRAFRVTENITPHSMRKIYAVEYYRKYKSLKRVQKLLNHKSEAVTKIYAMADQITKARKG